MADLSVAHRAWRHCMRSTCVCALCAHRSRPAPSPHATGPRQGQLPNHPPSLRRLSTPPPPPCCWRTLHPLSARRSWGRPPPPGPSRAGAHRVFPGRIGHGTVHHHLSQSGHRGDGRLPRIADAHSPARVRPGVVDDPAPTLLLTQSPPFLSQAVVGTATSPWPVPCWGASLVPRLDRARHGPPPPLSSGHVGTPTFPRIADANSTARARPASWTTPPPPCC